MEEMYVNNPFVVGKYLSDKYSSNSRYLQGKRRRIQGDEQ